MSVLLEAFIPDCNFYIDANTGANVAGAGADGDYRIPLTGLTPSPLRRNRSGVGLTSNNSYLSNTTTTSSTHELKSITNNNETGKENDSSCSNYNKISNSSVSSNVFISTLKAEAMHASCKALILIVQLRAVYLHVCLKLL